jgi:hypothetical protein
MATRVSTAVPRDLRYDRARHGDGATFSTAAAGDEPDT